MAKEMIMPNTVTSWTDIHPKVAVAALAALVYSIIAPLAARVGIDLSGQEGNLQTLIALAAAYLTPSN